MAVINDCSPPNALVDYHQLAINEVVSRLNDQIATLQVQATAADAVVTQLQDTLDALLGSVVNPDDLRTGCNLPKNPTQEDIESSIQGLTVIQGRVVLPGTLNLVAIKRLYSLYGSVPPVYALLPQLFYTPSDDVYGSYEGGTSILTVVVNRIRTEVESINPCTPDDVTVTETEVVVSVNQRLPEISDDPDVTRVVITVWVGPMVLSDSLRQLMVARGYTDEEIVNLVLRRSEQDFEVYQIEDPLRLGRYLTGVGASDGPLGEGTSFLDALLVRGPDSISDSTTTGQYIEAFKNAINSPSSGGCGVHPSIGLLATIDMSRMFPTSKIPDDCDFKNINIFGGVNAIFGGMGIIQKGIAKITEGFQKIAGNIIVKFADLASFAEKNLLGLNNALDSSSIPIIGGNGFGSKLIGSGARIGNASEMSATSQYGVALQGPGIAVPGIPQMPSIPNVSVAQIDQFVAQLDANIGVIEDFMNQAGRVVLGMSLLACASSQFGSLTEGIDLPLPGNPRIPFDLECARPKLEAELDLSGLTFDWMNQGMRQLQDIIHRLRALAEQLRQQQEGPEEMFKLKCSITETVQLATDIARRIAASNFGRF